jgi:intein/homing endonuclease
MRIKLKKGKQKELICKIKNKNQFTWENFSKFLNVSKPALIEWSRENNLLPLKVYKKLDPNNKYKEQIIELKKENWGQIKAGLNSNGTLKEIKTPKKCKKLAELIGSILGDGNIHSYKRGKKVRVYSVRIAGHIELDKVYHLKYIKPMFEELFNIQAKIYFHKKNNERFIIVYSRKVVDYLNNMGLKSGNKIKNENTIPRWIFKDIEFLKACLRGLIDTDGSVFRMSKKDPNLIRISFTNHNQTLLKDTRDAFIQLGFNPSRITHNNKIYLSRKQEIVKYINDIGFSNNKHIIRFQKFSSPIV